MSFICYVRKRDVYIPSTRIVNAKNSSDCCLRFTSNMHSVLWIILSQCILQGFGMNPGRVNWIAAASMKTSEVLYLPTRT